MAEREFTPVDFWFDPICPWAWSTSPVVTPIPHGEAPARLWDGVPLVAQSDGFFELKRSCTRDPVFG